MRFFQDRPFVVVYAAVISYFSVGFMQIALLPAQLHLIAVRDHPHASADDIAVLVSKHMGSCTLINGIFAVAIAGWTGRLSDRFGRRRCCALPATSQAIGCLILSLTAHFELSWQFVLIGYSVSGALGGPYIFLAASFAYIADWTKANGRGRAFAGIEGVMLYISAVGPLLAGTLVGVVGLTGIWGFSAVMYVITVLLFGFVAPPSPQVLTAPAPCSSWIKATTPVLLMRLWCGKHRPQLKLLALAFLVLLIGVNGGLQAFVLYAQRYLRWGTEQLGLFISLFSTIAATLILLSSRVLPPLLRCCGREMFADLSLVRGLCFGPLCYLLLLALLPSPETVAFAAMPLLGLNAAALPFLRALFSKAGPPDRQGETLMLVGALEAVGQMSAGPLAALGFALLLHAPRLVFILGAGLVACSILFLFCLREPSLQHRISAVRLLDAEGVSPDPASGRASDSSASASVVVPQRHLSFEER